MKMSLKEIRAMQDLSVKKKIPFSSVPDKEKKIFQQLYKRGIITRCETCWHLVKANQSE